MKHFEIHTITATELEMDSDNQLRVRYWINCLNTGQMVTIAKTMNDLDNEPCPACGQMIYEND